ncbi:MAG: hypothetical protein CUN56_05795 [Phototrophicales bacterium]|nr:MAG: hypothetical protein CUN56_05795 [Phototrophicales bacterium]RMG74501.1 MAG: hypothetical protein D6711_08655 [Chloroflexota bacterium]
MEGDTVRVSELLRAGLVALAAGDKAKAHTLWKQAAALNPKNEAVWLALLEVVNTHDDRRVCLENILAINPNNEAARRQLRVLGLLEGEIVQHPLPPRRRPFLLPLLQITLALLLIILFIVLGIVTASILNLL